MSNQMSLNPGRSGYREERSSSAAFVLGFLLLTGFSGACGAFIASQSVTETRSQMLQIERKSRSGPVGEVSYTAHARLRGLKPLVTNLAAPQEAWIRLQAALVLAEGNIEDVNVLASHIEEDIVAYLRTLTIAQIEGAVGLQHLREDLNERVRMRSKGVVREVILESLVIQ